MPITNTAGDDNPPLETTIDDTGDEVYLEVETSQCHVVSVLTLQIVSSCNTTVPLTRNLDVLYTSVNGTVFVRRDCTPLMVAAHGVQTNPDVNGFSFRNN